MNIPKVTAVLSALVVVAFAAETAKPRFDPVKKKIEGWTVFVEPAMLESAPDSEDARSLAMLEAHLRIITAMVPADRVEKLKKLEIWKLQPTNQGFREAQKTPIWEPSTK